MRLGIRDVRGRMRPPPHLKVQAARGRRTEGCAPGIARWIGRVLVAALVAAGPVSALAQEIGAAARVNGVEIGLFRLERHFEDYLKAQGRNVGAIRNPGVFKRLKREALDQLIDKELLWQEAQRRGIGVEAAAVAQTRAAIAEGFRSPDAFDRRVREAGFDAGSYDDYLRREIAAGRALDALVGTVTVSDEVVQRFYRDNRARFERPEEIRARHILLRASPDDAVPVEARARALLRELREGADFAELAKRHSSDSTAGQGGDLGRFGRGRMVPAFEAAAFALNPGETSEPVRTEFGWHLIKLEERHPASAMAEADALALVRRHLAARERDVLVGAALARLRAAAKVDILAGF